MAFMVMRRSFPFPGIPIQTNISLAIQLQLKFWLFYRGCKGSLCTDVKKKPVPGNWN